MEPLDDGSKWHVKMIKPRLPWRAATPRAVEVGEALRGVMLSREFALEDAEYNKIVPNEFVVELHQTNYFRDYKPIEARVLQQWHTMLLEHLTTSNSRQGRRLYQLSAPLSLKIRPVDDIKPAHVRILCRVQSAFTAANDPGSPAAHTSSGSTPCLEMLSGERRWNLRMGTITIGRDKRCTVHLDVPDIHDRRLVSGEHAFLRFEGGKYIIYDGSPDGRTSVNGTFVNRKPVPPNGCALKDGDEVILASLDPANPNPHAPGAAALRFREACS